MKSAQPITPIESVAAKPSHDFVYLASQSPRRRQLLEQIGVRFELLLPDPSEDAESLEAERPGELPLAYVQRVTLAKLEAARSRLIRLGLPPAPVPRGVPVAPFLGAFKKCIGREPAFQHRLLGFRGPMLHEQAAVRAVVVELVELILDLA